MSREGKELGKAEDLIIGKEGKIEYVILSKGGLLGIGSEKFAVPWDKVRTTPNVDQLMADVSESEIQKYAEGRESGGRESQRTAQSGQKSAVPLAQVDAQRANEFMDQKVTGRGGEELGQVKDMFTSQDGQPLYIVVQEQSSQMLHPIPAQIVHTNPQDKSLSVDLDKQAFMNSPNFDESQISKPQQWEPQVRGYYQSISQQQGRSVQQPPSSQRQQSPAQQQSPGGAQEQPQGMGEGDQQQSPPPGARQPRSQ